MALKDSFINIWKKVKIGIGILILLILVVSTYMILGHYSEGERGGTLIKISKKGFLFKTNEGQLNVGTFIDNGVNKSLSPIWDFSVQDDPAILEQLNHAILTNKRVKLHYQEKFIKLPWRGDNLYIVDKVELLD
jgi:hypothetical protein